MGNALRYPSREEWYDLPTRPVPIVLEEDVSYVRTHPLNGFELAARGDKERESDTARIRRIRRTAWQTVLQLCRFGMVGGLNTGIDLLIFNVLIWCWPTSSTMLLLGFNSLAYAFGGINSFILNKYWTFKHHRAVSSREVLRFVATTCVGIVCNDLIIAVMSNLVHSLAGNPTLWANVSKVVAIFGTMCVSFLGMRLWVFVKPGQTTKKA